ncbi:hypothetical protein Tco_0752322 [Tanacetum coccineum]|uniref:Uncharacterized protein n=1 Tax=Tanacetum coccineum TaxID=301880 RepID=A0ABQ4Z865_9ASTR
MTMDTFTKGALWDYWKLGSVEVEPANKKTFDLEETDHGDEQEIGEIFRIETNLFDYETPLCKKFKEFNYLLKIDPNVLTNDITEPTPVVHYCKPFNYKTGCSEWPTCSWREDGYCNRGNLLGAYIVGNTFRYQDLEWYDALKDSKLKKEALKNKAIIKGIIDDNDESIDDGWKRWDGYEITNHDREERYDEEYVAVKEDEYDDLMSTRKDACRAYQEIFRMMDEGWMVTRMKVPWDQRVCSQLIGKDLVSGLLVYELPLSSLRKKYRLNLKNDMSPRDKITSITVNGKNAYELKGKFLDDLHKNAFNGTNGEDAVEHIEYFLKIVDPIDLPNDPTNPEFKNWLASKFVNYMTMDTFTKGALWDYWKLGINEVEPANKKTFDLEETNHEWPTCSWREDGYCNGGNLSGAYIVGNTFRYQDLELYDALKDNKLKKEALKNKAIMEGIIDDNYESIDDRWKIWDGYEITNHD